MVAEWLRRATRKEGDLGWSLIHPRTRTEVIGSHEAYRAAILNADWSLMTYSIGDVVTADGDYDVTVVVPGGRTAVPERIFEWNLIEPGDDPVNLNVTVIISPNGGAWGIR